MVSAIVSRFVILTCGTLYPAYRSYKAVKTKNVREYVKWMMYWIVFALFLCLEAVADVFLSFWFPFYYESKILFVLWLLSPYTKGASFIYRKFVHPTLLTHEKEIDQYLAKAKKETYTRLMLLGNRGINYAKEAVATAALKGHEHLVGQVRKTSSLNDVNDSLSDNMQYSSPDEEVVVDIRRKERTVVVRGPPVDEADADGEYEQEEEESSMVDREFGYLDEEYEEEEESEGNGEEEEAKSPVTRSVTKQKRLAQDDGVPMNHKRVGAKDASMYGTMPRRSTRKPTTKTVVSK